MASTGKCGKVFLGVSASRRQRESEKDTESGSSATVEAWNKSLYVNLLLNKFISDTKVIMLQTTLLYYARHIFIYLFIL